MLDTRVAHHVLQQIQFKTGLLSRINDLDSDQKEDQSGCVLSYIVSVMRYEDRLAKLPVIGEEGPFQVDIGDRVELSVGTDQAFVVALAEVASVEKTRDGREALFLELNEVETYPRRLDDRLNSYTATRFIPLDRWKEKVHLGIIGEGSGQAMDFSLGGMQMLTQADLPNGFEAKFQIQSPGGDIQVKGKVVRRHLRTRLGTTYSIQFVDYDRSTLQRLRRFIVSERRKYSSSRNPLALQDRGRLSRRWDR